MVLWYIVSSYKNISNTSLSFLKFYETFLYMLEQTMFLGHKIEEGIDSTR